MPSKDTSSFENRFRSLSRLAVESAKGRSAAELLERAIAEAVGTMGLLAGAVRVFGSGDVDIVGAMAGDESGQASIRDLERTLLADLRRSYSVRSLFMTLDIDGPAGLFSYPLRSGTSVIGSISGIIRGERNLAVEEEFVASLAAMIVLIGRTGKPWGAQVESSDETHDESLRVQAVAETAAAVNHEINNPLMALVGNLDLLLRRSDQFDADSIAKLMRIREAADRIRNVTHDLMRIREARSVPYPGGGRMLDIDGSPKHDTE